MMIKNKKKVFFVGKSVYLLISYDKINDFINYACHMDGVEKYIRQTKFQT